MDTFMLIVGIILSCGGLLVLVFKAVDLFTCSQRIEAEITGVKTEKTLVRGSTVYTYHPKYRYTADGKSYTGTSPRSSLKENAFEAGGTLTLYVNPKKPESVRYPGFDGLALFAALAFCAGTILVICRFL